MAGPSRTNSDLVKVAYAHNEAEAEFLQGLLREADVGSVVRCAPGFDVPEFLVAGPRHVLVAASDVAVAHDGLREVEPGPSEPRARNGTDRRSRVLAGLLIPVALICARHLPRSRRARLSTPCDAELRARLTDMDSALLALVDLSG